MPFNWQQCLQYTLSGITFGSIYAVVAIGFNLIYRTTGILNFAQGEFVMLGGMSAVSLAAVVPLPVAVTGAVALVALCGGAMDAIFFRRLRSASILRMIVITIGLSILIREAALHVWDEKPRRLAYFTGDECSSVSILGAAISPQVFWVLGAVALVVLALQMFFHFTLNGKAMRACASNPEAAMLCGINIRNVRTLTFCLSGALGALGGCVVSPITGARFDMGADLAIKGFAAAVLGGLGNPMAGVAGGLMVGLAEAYSVAGLPAAYKDATSFGILLLALFIRPHGLIGSRQAAVVEEGRA
jgi:branched-chain amino acid transport system permease protein